MIAFTAPHHAASKAGWEILEQGGSAIEAMVAAAATIAVVYPHMNGLGGDGFWLISEPGKAPTAIDAAGTAAKQATPGFYDGMTAIPSRGGKAALTMAGAVSGWQLALRHSAKWQKAMPLPDLMANAVRHAKQGFGVTTSLQAASEKTAAVFSGYGDFEQFRDNGSTLTAGSDLALPKLAGTLEYLSEKGLGEFYHGDLGKTLAQDLEAAGSPIRQNDFLEYQATNVTPLSVQTGQACLYNLPAPTQGIASLIILALYDRLQHLVDSDEDHVHLLIECTKQAFIIRNHYLTDASRLQKPLEGFLGDDTLDQMASNIDLDQAMPWPHQANPGDTIWMGACDNQGRMVSYIQSLYWEFGSGIVSPSTGIVWNNRGTSFSLAPGQLQYLQPGLKPFHTLNPAYAQFQDGRRMVYGTMGGEGQPQTQAALFSRYAYLGMGLAQAISEPRWLLGRTWGDISHNLKIEDNIAPDIWQSLQNRGHDTVAVPALSEMMGHAGAIVLSPGALSQIATSEAATDPRSDGKAYFTEGEC